MAASRLLFDTNVLVSAILFGGRPGELVDAGRDGRCEAVVSLHIFRELTEVLKRPAFGYDADHAAAFAEAIATFAEVWPVEDAEPGECRDPRDEPMLLAAVLARANCIVTGDANLLALSDPPVSIVTVETALRLLSG